MSNSTRCYQLEETANPQGAHEFTLAFSEVHVAQSANFYVVFCQLLFVLLSPFVWRYCIVCPKSWIQILIIPLGHSNVSYGKTIVYGMNLHCDMLIQALWYPKITDYAMRNT